MIILGIDPGASGALAFFDPDSGTLDIIDTPVVEVMRGNKAKRGISPPMLAALIKARMPDQVILERVGAMPGQGVSSMFQFGRGVGMVEGVVGCLALPLTYVSPIVWQRATGARGGKGGARQRAAELFPAYAQQFARVKDDGRADAALIAWCGVTK